MKNKEKQFEEFKEVCKPLVKYLNENHHPHCTIIVTPTWAELVEWLKQCKIHEFVKG